MHNANLVVIFYFSWKMQPDVWSTTINDQGVVIHITGGNFTQSSILLETKILEK
jgi:photosystem I P700 chlorophyll a apoprotein A1